MRLPGTIALVAAAGLLPRIALAHPSHHDSPVVHDHRSSSGGGEHHSEPVFHDHRSSEIPTPVVRDHRGGSYVATTDDEIIVDDGGYAAPAPGPRPSYTFEIGGIARRFTGPAITRTGSVETTSGDYASYSLASGTPSQGDTAAGAFALRMLVPLGDHLYGGAELELGGLTRSPITLMTDSSDIHIASQALIGSAMVVGARARRGIAELDGELAGGVRVVSTTIQSLDATEDDPSETENAVGALVEARVRGALWVTPHLFVGATAGIGALDPSERSVGLSLGFSSYAFGSAR